jgi:hypothetical protein
MNASSPRSRVRGSPQHRAADADERFPLDLKRRDVPSERATAATAGLDTELELAPGALYVEGEASAASAATS